MITVNCLRDLEQFGIIPLTGEADALSYRVLCDLTTRGAKLVAEAFGLRSHLDPNVETPFLTSWNGGRENDPHVACVMLAHDAWRQIAPIALCARYKTVFSVQTKLGFKRDSINPNREIPVYSERSCIMAVEDDETFSQAEWEYNETTGEVKMTKPAQINGMEWPTCYGKIDRYFAYNAQPREGSRNVHAMSGRTV